MEKFETLYWGGSEEQVADVMENGLRPARVSGVSMSILHRYPETCLNRFDLFNKEPLPLTVLEIDVSDLPPGSLLEYPPDGLMLDIRGEHLICVAAIPAGSIKLAADASHAPGMR